MRSRSWFILVLGYSGLLALIVLLSAGALRRARQLQEQTLRAHETYLRIEEPLRDVPQDLYLGAVLVRDYLLDLSHLSGPYYRERLVALRSSVQTRLDLLEQRLGESGKASLRKLRDEVEAYWSSLDPIFDWTPQQKAALSYGFLRRQILPRRDGVIALAMEVDQWNAQNFQQERARIRKLQDEFERFLFRLSLVAVLLGLAVALLSAARVLFLERRADRQRLALEQAEQELRRLSRNLVQAQETERKSLSRELHDAVGQMLTAMGMELANLEMLQRSSPERFHGLLDELRRLNAETLRTVRDLAMGLRPSMLDDLGLGPALEWQARDFSRRSGIPVTVQMDGSLDDLPETHRTCIFRVVQEALTNCARHSQASAIRVAIHGRPDWLTVTVQDDGIGFERAHVSAGLGLLGMEERVRELDGTIEIASQPHKGTLLKVDVPIRKEVPA